MIRNLFNMGSQVFGNMLNQKSESITNQINGQTAQKGLESATDVQIGIAETKAAMNLKKIPSGYAATAFAEAARMAMQ